MTHAKNKRTKPAFLKVPKTTAWIRRIKKTIKHELPNFAIMYEERKKFLENLNLYSPFQNLPPRPFEVGIIRALNQAICENTTYPDWADKDIIDNVLMDDDSFMYPCLTYMILKYPEEDLTIQNMLILVEQEKESLSNPEIKSPMGEAFAELEEENMYFLNNIDDYSYCHNDELGYLKWPNIVFRLAVIRYSWFSEKIGYQEKMMILRSVQSRLEQLMATENQNK